MRLLIRAIPICMMLLWFSSVAFGQNYFTQGVMPGAKLTKVTAQHWVYTFGLESRSVMDNGLDHIRSDAYILAGKKLASGRTLSVGYFYLYKEATSAHRITQRYRKKERLQWGNLSYRLSSDQTFEGSEFVLRFRGRLTAEIPVKRSSGGGAGSGSKNGSGSSTANDSGSGSKERVIWSLKPGVEYLTVHSGGEQYGEYRLTPMLAYHLSEKNVVEMGIDYRIKAPFQPSTGQYLWFKLTWYTTL